MRDARACRVRWVKVVVVVVGGAAGTGVAGAARQLEPKAEITECEGTAFSSCAIPYVLGRAMSSFDELLLQSKGFCEKAGVYVRDETW